MQVHTSPPHARPASRSGNSPQVLLIGSDSVISRALQLFLRSEGYDTVVVAADGEGWLTARAVLPDLVLVASTVSAARRAQIWAHLKGDPHTRHIPVVALLDLTDTTNGSLNEYADATLTWPFRLKEVLVLVEELLASPPTAE